MEKKSNTIVYITENSAYLSTIYGSMVELIHHENRVLSFKESSSR